MGAPAESHLRVLAPVQEGEVTALGALLITSRAFGVLDLAAAMIGIRQTMCSYADLQMIAAGPSG